MKYAFISGNPARDFVGTLWGRRDPVSGDTLGSRLADGVTGSRPSHVATAVALREAMYSLFAARLAKVGYDESALRFVNHIARTPPVVPQFTATGRLVEATPEQAMSSVARPAIEVLGWPEGELLKECGRPGCPQVYVGRSRGARRSWCAMETCGNRVKSATYRARQRATRVDL